MFGKINAVSPGTVSPAEPAPNPQGPKRFSKKHLVIIAAVAIIVVVAVALMIPQGAASIPLTVNYSVGEKMVYDTSVSVGLNFGNSSSALSGLLGSNGNNSNLTSTGQEILQVLSYNDPYYTINQTISMNLPGDSNSPLSISNVETMDNTGCTTFLANFGGGSDASNPASEYYLAQLLDKSEVKVGDSITVPYPTMPANLSSLFQISGSLTLTFKGFQDLTVPAGTFKVFRVDISSNDLTMTMNSSFAAIFKLATSRITANLNFQLYYEYGTMRLIQSTMTENAQLQSSIFNYSIAYGIDMTLNQDVKP